MLSIKSPVSDSKYFENTVFVYLDVYKVTPQISSIIGDI